MPYKRTGRPPGRPKTKEYATLMARVPQAIADQTKQYASRKRQTISEVLRDGLDLLLQDDRHGAYLSDTNSTSEKVSDNIPAAMDIVSYTNSPTVAREKVSDTNGTPEHTADMLRMQRLRAIVSDTNDAPESVPDMMSDMNGAHPAPLATADLGAKPFAPVAMAPQPIPIRQEPAYDPTADELGPLCEHGHDYQGTGQSPRRKSDNECRQCRRDRNAAYKARKRQAAPVA